MTNLQAKMPWHTKVLVFSAWLVTNAAAFWQVFLIHDLAAEILFYFVRDRPFRVSLKYSVRLIDAVIYTVLLLSWLIFLIINTNYHLRHAGQRRSWRMLAYTVAVQVLVFLAFAFWA